MIDGGLLQQLKQLEHRVALATQRFREGDPDPENAFRGLYLTDEHVDRLLDRSPTPGAGVEIPEMEPNSVLALMARAFGLEAIDAEILVAAVAPDLDRRFEQFYGYLHDDITRRRASPGLVIDLLGLSPFDGDLRRRFASDAPLRHGGLVDMEELDRPFLSRSLRVPDRVLDHLLGNDEPDSSLVDVLVEGDRPPSSHEGRGLRRVLERSGAVLYLRERVDCGAPGLAASALEAIGRRPLLLDLRRAHPEERRELALAAVREARLVDGGLVVGPVDGLDDGLIMTLAESPATVVLHGASIWDPARTLETVLVVELEPLAGDEQRQIWSELTDRPPDDLAALLRTFRLGPSQIRRAVGAGRAHATMHDRGADATSFAVGARTQNAVGLEKLARRVAPEATWDDIVLPDATMDQLHHLVMRVAHRRQVLDEWGFRRGGGRGEGIAALFAGDSGTGKTLAAEVVARALGLDLYVIDLSSVVDKYIGETEKNLDRVFNEAEGVNGVLFFDEADALFGKRSEISDAKDRYANVEVAYLLQRMEQFDGLAILASNLRGNLDEAFARRLALVVDFPDPDVEQRRRLWDVLLGNAPLDSDADLDFLAEQFTLSGGNIRNIAVTAAYLAADSAQVVGMETLIRGVQYEYRKLGRLCLASEFGEHMSFLDRGLRASDTEDREQDRMQRLI